MSFAFRREYLIVAAIFASANFLELCDCACNEQEERETDLAFTSARSIYDRGNSGSDPVKIDAFDYHICGQSKQRDWQSKEKAWKCGRKRSSGWSARSSRIANGEYALDGEFPSFVHLIAKRDLFRDTIRCGGTLIHSNLVITAAHCVEDMTSITAVLDSNRVDGGGYEVKADSWCLHSDYDYDFDKGAMNDLGMVRLSRKVDYVANRVWPACLLLDHRHWNNSACALAGKGREDGYDFPERLKTIPIKRTCSKGEKYPYVSCYQADSIGGACLGDSGSGVLCYDNCYAGDQRAFVVGAVSGVADTYCTPGKRLTQLVTDFNWMANSVRAIIRAMVSNATDNAVTCYNSK